MKFSFSTPIIPIGKQRARKGRNGFYTPDKTKEAEEVIAWYCREAMQQQSIDVIDKPVKIKIKAYFPVKYKDRHIKNNPHINKPDVDNIAKLVLDALNKVLYTDDKLIYHLEIIKLYADEPYVMVVVEC